MKGRSGPKLPGQLLDELGSNNSATSSRSKGKAKKELGSRKEQRKARREEKKARRHQHHSRKAGLGDAVEAGDEGDDFITDPWGGDEDASDEEIPPKPLKSILKKLIKPSNASGAGGVRSPSPPPVVSRRAKEKRVDEDAEIEALEKKLGIKGKRNLPKSFEEDGLGDLLDGLDDFVASTGKRKREEYEAWLRNKRRKADTDVFEGFSDEDDDPFEAIVDAGNFEKSGSELDFESESESPEFDIEGGEDEDIDIGEAQSGRDDLDEALEEPETEHTPAQRMLKIRENPYQPPISAEDNESASGTGRKYIPPALRATASTDEAILAKLQRQLQGLLNRLSEANMLAILKDIEQMYENNSRQQVTATLIQLLISLISNPTSLNDTFIILHAAFIASVYKVTGTQFGAQLLDRLVAEIDSQYEAQSSNPIGSKDTTNLIALLTELYTFQIVSSTIIFDYIRSLLASISELNTELLLKIIRNCGPQLRSEDPSSLKDIVILLQKAVKESGGEEKLPVRTRFMIETINNLKNNRHKAGAEASALAQVHRTRMKKTLGTLNARAKASEPLGMGLEDLRAANKDGQWWLVGARWKNPNFSTSDEHDDNPPLKPTAQGDTDAFPLTEPDIATLSKQAGMNTAIRRAIFTTLLSSEDYKDCHTRLQKLRLNRKQELEIPRVVLHCAGAEQSYNRYYTLVAKRLCSEHRMRMAFQFALWGVLKAWGERFINAGTAEDDIEEEDDDSGGDLRKVVNLARMYGDLVAAEVLPVTILKTLNFAYLKEKTRLFVEVMLVSVLQKKVNDDEGVIRVFARAKDALQIVTGLKFFLENVVAKSEIVRTTKEKEVVRNGCKAAITALGLLANTGSR